MAEERIIETYEEVMKVLDSEDYARGKVKIALEVGGVTSEEPIIETENGVIVTQTRAVTVIVTNTKPS